ncbi:MAG: hypothetical protein ACK4GG_10360 [Sphingomonas sp.]
MLGTDMAKVWQGDDVLLDLIRDREVLQHVLADVAGEGVANASEGATGEVKRTIIRDCLNGENGRAKVEGWVPKWMAFPPSCLHRARWGRDRQPGGQGQLRANPSGCVAQPDVLAATAPPDFPIFTGGHHDR